MRRFRLILAAAFTFIAGCSWAAQAPVKVLLAYHVAHTVTEEMPVENNADIMKALKEHPNLGGTVYIYLQNRSNRTIAVRNIAWDGKDVKARLKAPDYDVMWWKSAPRTIAPGLEGEVTVCLRESLKKDTVFVLDLGDAGKVECHIKAEYLGPKLSTVAFSPDLESVYLYVDTVDGKAPDEVYIDGKPAGKSAKLLGGRTASGLAVIKVTPEAPFRQGERHLIRVSAGKHICAGSVRALGDLSRFGTYGFPDSKTFSSSGLNSYISFGVLDEKTLNEFGAVGMKAAMTIGFKKPDPYMIGNPSIYGYLAMDEPDCHDFSHDTSRPMHKRLGTFGQSLVEWGYECEKADGSIPTITTIDLTFAPQNYFAYAKIADIANPDCYTLVTGWPLTAFRDKMAIMKRASAPQPFLATYQGYWEEHAKDLGSRYVGAAEIEAQGSEVLLDTTRMRGFGRSPSPEETRIPMLYAIGSGARGLFNYIASTEAFSTLLFHSTRAMPEVWQMMTRTSRELRTVAPLIQTSHPIDWCKVNKGSLWVKTLVCGEDAALVVAVNEACKSEKEGFVSSPIQDIEFTFADLPWLKARNVYSVGDGKLDLIKSANGGGTLRWSEQSIVDGSVYLVCSDGSLADNLVKKYASTPPYATPEGMQAPEEGYLKGRRKTPRQ